MDTDKIKQDADEKTSDPDPDTGNLLQSSWIRCSFCAYNEIDRILSGNRYYFLLHFNILFLLILAIIKKR